MEIAQSAVAKLEHAEGDRVSTLPDCLDAIGARLAVVAVFDDDRGLPVHLGKEPVA